MKTAKEVLTALNVIKPTPKQKEHAKTLAEIYVMLKEIAPSVVQVTRKEQQFNFGLEMFSRRWDEKPTIRTKGLEMNGEKWTIKTPSGSYTVSLPTDNALYYAFANLFPQLIQVTPGPQTISPDRILIFDKIITSEVKKAMKFIVFDKLRAAMNCVHVTVKDGRVEIMGTNGTKLYRSGYLEIDETKDITFLLPIDALKAAKVKDSLTIGLYYDRDTITKGIVNGVEFSFDTSVNWTPLNYDNVIPTYYDFVEFDRKELIQVVKSVLPTANKTTHALKFYFNGSIQVTAEDLDFSHENDVRINYHKKTANDFKIALNGKLLLDCLETSSEKTARLYSDGEHNKCILIDDKALLMPVIFIDKVEKTAEEIAKELHELRNAETI